MAREEDAAIEHYAAESYQMGDSVLYLTSLARARCLCALDASMAELGLTTAQFGILKVVQDGSEDTAAELCRRYNMDPGAMARMLDKLDEKGLIQRERSSEDRRVVRIALTDSGRALCEQGIDAAVKTLNHSVRNFSKEELDTFKDALRRVIANME
jgi:DNA-binding MarR family transcriptional regulator